jgi:hypothetical protein
MKSALDAGGLGGVVVGGGVTAAVTLLVALAALPLLSATVKTTK